MCFLVFGFKIEPVLGLSWAVLGLSWAAWSCPGLCWCHLGTVLGLSWAVLASLDLSGGCPGLGFSLDIPESPKTLKINLFFNVFGFKVESALACLGLPRPVCWAVF